MHEALERVDLDQALEQRLLLVVVSALRKAPDSIFSRSHTRWRWLAMCSIS